MGRSSLYNQMGEYGQPPWIKTTMSNIRLTSIPLPLSVIWSSLSPPSFTKTSRDVEPASTAFSINSFSACMGATMISPAAILFTTSGSRAYSRISECKDFNEIQYSGLTLILLGFGGGSVSSSAVRLMPRGSRVLSMSMSSMVKRNNISRYSFYNGFIGLPFNYRNSVLDCSPD